WPCGHCCLLFSLSRTKEQRPSRSHISSRLPDDGTALLTARNYSPRSASARRAIRESSSDGCRRVTTNSRLKTGPTSLSFIAGYWRSVCVCPEADLRFSRMDLRLRFFKVDRY